MDKTYIGCNGPLIECSFSVFFALDAEILRNGDPKQSVPVKTEIVDMVVRKGQAVRRSKELMVVSAVIAVQTAGCRHPDVPQGILGESVHLSAGKVVRHRAGEILLRNAGRTRACSGEKNGQKDMDEVFHLLKDTAISRAYKGIWTKSKTFGQN